MKKYYILSSLLVLSFITACGGDKTPIEVPLDVSASSKAEADNQQIKKILESLNAISSKLDKLESSKNQTVVVSSIPSIKPTTLNPIQSIKPNEIIKTPEPIKPTSSPTSAPKVTGRKILDTIISNVYLVGAVEADLENFEKSLDSNKTSSYNMKLYSEKTKRIRIDILESSNSSSVGAKITYVSGDANKVKVRPPGALSIITTEMEKNDTRIGGINGYALDQTDFFGMAKRFSDTNYDADLTGTTKINGSVVYVLKIKCKTINNLDKRIKSELLYFDPKTFVIRGWEAFTTEDTNLESFYRLTIKNYKISDIFPEGTFKI